MGLACDYFVAPCDRDAAATLDRHDRTDGPGDDGPPYPTVDGRGVDPSLHLVQLHEVCTGERFIELHHGPVITFVAERNGAERVVVKLTGNLTTVLASASDAQLERAATRWSQARPSGSDADADRLVAVLRGLCGLVRLARRERQHVYCSLSV